RLPWPLARPQASHSSTLSLPNLCSKTTTSCRASAATSSKNSAAWTRRAQSSSARPASRATPANVSCCSGGQEHAVADRDSLSSDAKPKFVHLLRLVILSEAKDLL